MLINNLPSVRTNAMKNFAGGTKLMCTCRVKDEGEYLKIITDLESMVYRADK